MRVLKVISIACGVGVALSIAWATYQVTTATAPATPLAPNFPAGAVLSLEAKD